MSKKQTKEDKIIEITDRIMDEVISFNFMDIEQPQYYRMRDDIIAILSNLDIYK